MRLPVAGWLANYPRSWLRADVVAGITAAAVVVPKAMAYAAIAGLAVQSGLYTALAAMLVYPLLGGARALSVTTTSAIAMLTAAQVAAVGAMQPDVSAASVAATLALLVGIIMIVARLLRLGFLANFVSLPVLVGFEAGVGIVIVVGQIKSLLGVSVQSHTTLGVLLELPALLPQAHGATMLVALVGLAVILGIPRLIPALPAPLVWVALSIAVSVYLDLEAIGVRSIGTVPSGLPAMGLPNLALAAQLLPAALGIALMSFTESVAASRAFGRHDDVPIQSNQELLAVGSANLACAFVGGMPAGGGASQTAVVDNAGARSQMSQWICASVVLLILLVLAPVVSLLPQVALGVLILVSAVGMIKPKSLRAIARVRRTELAWALTTLVGVVLIGTLEGILIAVAISVLTLVYQANHPPVYAVAYNREQAVFRRAGEDDRDETFPGLLMLRTEGRLTFANAETVAEAMRVLVAQTQPQVIVLECSAIPDIEYTALTMLTEAEQNLRDRGVILWLAAVNPDLQKVIERSPLGQALGPGRVLSNLHQVLQAWRANAHLAAGPATGVGPRSNGRGSAAKLR